MIFPYTCRNAHCPTGPIAWLVWVGSMGRPSCESVVSRDECNLAQEDTPELALPAAPRSLGETV